MATKCGCNCNTTCVRDICNTPICGRPDMLSIYAPVIYDEIGINICRPITLPADVIAANPTVACIQLEIIDIVFTAGTETVPGTTVTNSVTANCSTVILTNVLVYYRVKLYDNKGNYLAETFVTANYLPANAESTDYAFVDTETNPESVTLELYTPYGVGVTDNVDGTNYINVVGLVVGSNYITNGINASAVAKAMNFNVTTGVFSAGISIVLRTVYFEAYKIAHEGKPIPPKANLNGAQGNTCLEFVESGLLSREIKPLELEPPKCEGKFKDVEAVCERNDCTLQVLNMCQCLEEDNNPYDNE